MIKIDERHAIRFTLHILLKLTGIDHLIQGDSLNSKGGPPPLHHVKAMTILSVYSVWLLLGR